MKFAIKGVLSFFAIILVPFTFGFASPTQLSVGTVRFIRYSTLEGLSSSSQSCVAQDKEGFIWIGTSDGLNRFDGYTFKVYREIPGDSSNLRNNMIVCLFVDSKDNLWVGTQGGISRYDKEKDNFYTYPSLRNFSVECITEDKYKRIWIGTTSGLFVLDPETNHILGFQTDPNHPFATNTIAYYFIDKIVPDSNTLWIAYPNGILSSIDATTMTFKHYRLFDVAGFETAACSVNSLVLDNDRIWISTWSRGIWIFDKTSGKSRAYDKEKSQYINFIFKDTKGKFWYSPESEGLVLMNGQRRTTYVEDDLEPNSISSNLLSNIFQDREGNLWITSKRGDLNCAVPDSPFRNWYKNPSSRYALTSNLVYAVMEDSRNRIWVGYEDGGIDILDAGNAKPKVHINGDNSSGLGPGPVMDIFESRDGTIWVGKYLDGVRKYNESTSSFIPFKHTDNDSLSIAANDVRDISEDHQGNLWIALHGGGVDMFNPKTGIFTHHRFDYKNPSSTLLNDWTFAALCEGQNNVWVCSIVGVSVLSENGKAVRQYTSINTGGVLSNDISYVVFIDSRKHAWIGTADGLNQLDPETGVITKYFASDGLPGNQIMSIMEDNNHDIWIGTMNGLSKFHPEDSSFRTFYVQDGLATNDFCRLVAFKNRYGEMYFGGRGGLTRFNPDSIKINPYEPPVYITGFKLFNQEVKISKNGTSEGFSIPQQITYSKEITLEHNQNEITFEFAALNYRSPEKNQYKYKLVGFDNQWSFAGYKREVTYTNLDPGKYTFEVVASNDDGIWNNQGATLEIIVKPPLWRTKWAYGLYFSLVIFLLYIFRKVTLHEANIKRKLELEELEIQKLHEMDLLKMQFFANVSHEFRTPLTLIIGPIERMLHDAKDELQQMQLKLINRNAKRLLRLINQLMDFRKIEEAKLELNLTKSDVVHFVKDIVDTFNQDAMQQNINFTFESSHPSFDVWFDTDKLDKIIYNLLANAFKFTRDNGRITVSLDIDVTPYSNGVFKQDNSVVEPGDKTFKISVRDSGIGIPKDAQEKIFDRFYQVKNPLTNQGTGIGLSFTYELVNLHHGKIAVESELGKGSEFTVVLPLWIDEAELPHLSLVHESNKLISMNENATIVEKSDGESESGGDRNLKGGLPKILIIEDNADMRLFIKNEFKDNYNVYEARDGIIGIEKAFEEIPDAIICDVMMPGKDGYEVCRVLKNDERSSHIPIVMLTAKSSEQHTIEGFESGADDYVAKPFSAAVLKVRIKNLIEARISLRRKFMKEPFAELKELSPSRTDEKLFQKVYSIVEKNLNNPDFDVNKFASEIGMSRTQLYRKIDALSGESVKEFIRVIRLKKAAELLITTDSNVSEVAYSVGFNSLSYFTTSFTEYYGMNPTKFVEQHTL